MFVIQKRKQNSDIRRAFNHKQMNPNDIYGKIISSRIQNQFIFKKNMAESNNAVNFMFIWEQNKIKFTFPSNQSLQKQLKSMKQLKNYYQQICLKELNLPFKDLFKLNRGFRSGESYILSCKFCTCRIKYSKNDQSFILSKFTNQHDHIIVRNKAQQKKYSSYCLYKPGLFSADSKQYFTKKSQDYAEYSQKMLKSDTILFQINRFQQLQNYLRDHTYEYRFELSGEKQTEYPKIFVIVTQTMIKNYCRYGDLLNFVYTDQFIKQKNGNQLKYKLGIFYVIDTNLRVLLAGLSITCEETAETFQKLFTLFTDIHKTPPKVLVTDEKQVIQTAISQMNKKGMSIVQIYDPFHIIRAVRKSIVGNNQQKAALIKLFSIAIRTRSLAIYQKSLSKLFQCEQNAQMLEQILKKASKIFFMDIPEVFIGFERSNYEKIYGQIQIFIPTQVQIPVLIAKMSYLDQFLDLKSQKTTKCYSQQTEKILQDERVLQVRGNFEKKVFKEFFDNYLRYILNVEVSKSYDEDKIGWVATQRDTKLKFFISEDWKCSCHQVLKTGIPCSHLIAAIHKTKDVSYAEFFNPRWKKVIPEIQDPKSCILWVKRKEFWDKGSQIKEIKEENKISEKQIDQS